VLSPREIPVSFVSASFGILSLAILFVLVSSGCEKQVASEVPA